jgi:sporulation protein YlmC with PRC-barrel domain
MLQNIQQLYGKKLGATDGDVGHVKDFYFDDKTWAIRYVVVETASWLLGRQVLLAPYAFANRAFERSDADTDALRLNLTRKQIEDSPPIYSHRPVSRQQEEEYFRYYGWPTYWQNGGMLGLAGFPVVTPPTAEIRAHDEHNKRDDLHLRSAKALTGYHIHASEGQIGSVSSFIVDSENWTICEVVVETGHWYAGKTIHILSENIERISYDDSTVFVNFTINDILKTAKNDVAHAVTG